MIRFAFITLLALAATGCGRAPAPQAVDAVVSAAIKSQVSSVEKQAREFPASVATLTVKAENKSYLVVRFRAVALGFNQITKVGVPVLVRGQEQFKTNLYLGADDCVYISDLGTAQTPRFYRVGLYGVPTTLGGRPNDGDKVVLRLDPGVSLALSADTSGDKPAIDAALTVKATPAFIMTPKLWSRAL